MNMQIMPSQALSFGSQEAYFDAWGTAVGDIALGRTAEGRFARNVISAYWLALPVGSALRATAPLRAGMTWVRHPIAKYLSVYQAGTRIGSGARIYLQASKGLRYANYVAFAMNPLATYHYLRSGQYDKAMIQYFGPVGSVFIYNKFTESSNVKTVQPSVVKPTRKPTRGRGKKPSKMSKEQKRRLWRMGLRWCRKHNRYDRCSLRGR